VNIDYAQAWLDAFFTSGEATRDFYAEDGVFTDPILDQHVEGHEQMMRLFPLWSMRDVFGTHKFIATSYLGDEKLGVFNWVWQANFVGDVMLGMPTGGVTPYIEGITVQVYDENGKITRDWTYWDAIQTIKQLPYPINTPPATPHLWRDGWDQNTDQMTAPRPIPPALEKLEWSPGPYDPALLEQLRSVPKGAESVARMDLIDTKAQPWLDAFFTSGETTRDFYAKDGIFEDPILDQHVVGHDRMMKLFPLWSMRELFGTHKFVATDYLGGEKLGVFNWVWQANFQGDVFLGMPTGGVQPFIDGITVQVFDDDGKVIRDWTYWDGIQLIKQLPYPITAPPATPHMWRDGYDPATDDMTSARPMPEELAKLEWSPGPYDPDLLAALRANLAADHPTVTGF
jgi:steroid delta-isomerase-like uncharacterized protein